MPRARASQRTGVSGVLLQTAARAARKSGCVPPSRTHWVKLACRRGVHAKSTTAAGAQRPPVRETIGAAGIAALFLLLNTRRDPRLPVRWTLIPVEKLNG